MHSGQDPALDALFHPFDTGQLEWPRSNSLFLRARAGHTLARYADTYLTCTQGFKPATDSLGSMGLNVVDEDHALAQTYAITLLLPPRQRDEARALMARAIAATERGGRVVVAAPNSEGARSMQADLEKLGLTLHTLSKHKCRVCWSSPLEHYDSALAAEWRDLDRVQTIANGEFLSRPGIFAWNRIDPASALLAEHLSKELAGHAADLGAGFGYLSTQLLNRCAGITRLDMYEAESRALELARLNTARVHTRAQLRFHWYDVTQGLLDRYDVVVTNPPFHAGTGSERPDVGRRFISAAADALRPGGRLLLVANRHLPYESVLDRHFGDARIVTQEHGFKIVDAVKAGGS